MVSPAAANKAKIAGVIGWPVSHSLSPRLHQFWLKQYGIDGHYNAVAAEPAALSFIVPGLVAQGWRGFNLTIPHKETIIPLLSEIDEAAKHIGAVNTVIIKDGKLIGRNTDAYGFWENIRPHVKQKKKAVILGAGGAARAVLQALLDNGFTHIVLTNRSRERAEILARGNSYVTVCNWEDRSSNLHDADLLVNTTSLGMAGKEALAIDLTLLPVTAVVNDIVYTPLMTPLLKDAKAKGNIIVDGLGMLLHQAVPAFEAWFGVKPEVTDALRAHVLGAAS